MNEIKKTATPKGQVNARTTRSGLTVATGVDGKVAMVRTTGVQRVVVKDVSKRKMFVTMPTVRSLELRARSDEATSGGVHMFGRRREL